MTLEGWRRYLSTGGWAALAVISGMLVALLPVRVAGSMTALSVLLVLVLVEPSLALVLMIGVAPLKTLIATESPLVLPVDLGQLTFGLAVLLWGLRRSACDRSKSLPRTRLYLPLIIILGGFTPSLFSAASATAWLSEALKWIEMLLLVLIVLDQAHRWEWLAFGLVLAGVLQALIGLYEFRGGSGAPHLWIRDYQNFRAFGTFGQPNPFSAFMGLTLPLALGLSYGYAGRAWQAQRTRSEREVWLPAGLALWYSLGGLILLGGLLASWGRGAWLGFGAAAAIMVFFAPQRRGLAFLLLALAGTIVVGLWLAGFIPISIQARVDNAITEFVGFGDMRGKPISNDNFAIVERLAHWQAAYSMASAHPWIGVGLGNYEIAYPEYGIPSWPRPLGHAHNDYLNMLAEAGLIGLTTYLAAWVMIGWMTLQALRQTDLLRRGLVLGLMGTWTHLAVHSFVDKLYVNNLFLHVGVMLGLLAIAFHQRQQQGS